MEYIPKVLQAVAGEDFTIYLYFSDGSVRLYDAKPLLQQGGVFEPMRDPDYFRDRLTVLNDTAAWDVSGDMDPCNCIDLDPIELDETCPVVDDPLDKASCNKTQRHSAGASSYLRCALIFGRAHDMIDPARRARGKQTKEFFFYENHA